MEKPVILSVTELTQQVKTIIEGNPSLQSVCVCGEISNFQRRTNGHIYLTLKDDRNVLQSVMFARDAQKLHFQPRDGMKVIAGGRMAVYGGAGRYQLIAEVLSPLGAGDLYQAFEQLKEKLLKEGLFSPEHKKPLPRYPRRIALITSPTGAAVRDMLRIMRSRYPIARIRILPVRVQGTDAPGEIVEALRFANHYRIADLIILGRGGGSIEDLWAFNEESVARAIYDSVIPVISAVGHEPDVTISDFVADVRAATPSNGAEIAVPDTRQLCEQLHQIQKRMSSAVQSRIEFSRKTLRMLRNRPVMQSPEYYIQDRRMAWMYTADRFENAVVVLLERQRRLLAERALRLDAMSPLRVLGRGYALAQTQEGSLLTDASVLHKEQRLTLVLSKGSAICRVEDIHSGE